MNDPIHELFVVLKEADKDHQFDAILNEEQYRKEFLKETKEVQETLAYLSEFGDLIPISNKLKKFVKDLNDENVKMDLDKSIQVQANLSEDELLQIYKVAYTHFTEGKFEKAAAIARLLSHIQPKISIFQRLIGTSQSKLGKEKEALATFLYAALLEPFVIENHLSALASLKKLGFTEERLTYYNQAKEIFTTAKQWDDVKKLDLKVA